MTTQRKTHFFGSGKYYIIDKIMKKYITIISLVLIACSSNKQLLINLSECNFNDTISESNKIVDVKPYIVGQGGWTIINNDSIETRVVPDSDGWRKYIVYKKLNIEKHILYHEKSLHVTNSFLFYNKGSFNIGNEYIYNDKGEVIKTIDHNQYNKYPICYKEIIKSTIKKAGRKFYFQGLERDSLIDNNVTEYSWKVYFEDSISKSPTLIHKFYRINAKTGKTITEKIVKRLPM